MPAERIGGVLLAAGAGKRFGADKLAAELRGESLLYRSVTAMLRAALDPVIVVVAPGTERPVPHRATTVVNDRSIDGIATSVQVGLATLRDVPDVAAAVIAPADQPWCGAAVHQRLVEAYKQTNRPVVVATFGGAVRNPVLLARGQWCLSERICGDVGLSAVVRELSPLRVECDDVGSVADVDTPADLVLARRTEEAQAGGA